MKRLPFVEHVMMEPFDVPVDSDLTQDVSAIYIFPPTHTAVKAHRKLNALIARADKERRLESQKNMTKEVIENMQELWQMIDAENAGNISEMIKESVEKKESKGLNEMESLEETQAEDDVVRNFYTSQILPYLKPSELESLYDEFAKIINNAPSNKMFCLDSERKTPLKSGGVKTLETKINDYDMLLAKYLYFFMNIMR